MHKYPQNQSYVGSSGQTLTTNVPMTLCSWQIPRVKSARTLQFVKSADSQPISQSGRQAVNEAARHAGRNTQFGFYGVTLYLQLE